MYINTKLGKLLEYLDFFGTTFTFYTEGGRKLYTPLGGILTILSIIVSIFILVYIKLEDFLHYNPISSTTSKINNYRNIKFREEKIWIPWRIRDFGGKTVNHKDFLYPIIFYYKGIRNHTLKKMEITYDLINYKLCNETSMVNYTDSFSLDVDLDKLYCFEMDYLDMGGGWEADFINYIEFDLFICEGGIDYDENNTKCSSYEKIIKVAGQDNSYLMNIYYPVVHYQPMNKENPIFVKYDNLYYHLSRFTNKIDRFYLQQHILKDDTGWVIKNEKTYSYWGYMHLSGDNYANGDEKDIMNEGSSSRLYSFNLYLSTDVVFYNRYYKKILSILSNGLPIINSIFGIFKLIAIFFKISSQNQKITELLFENLQKNSKTQKFKILEKRENKFLSEKNDKNIINIRNSINNINIINQKNSNNNNNILSSFKIFTQNEKEKNKDSIKSKNESSIIQNILLSSNQMNDAIYNTNNDNSKKNYIRDINVKNKKTNEYININKDKLSSISPLFKDICINKYSFDKIDISSINKNSNNNINYKKQQLFPYKYYLCIYFLRNSDYKKKSVFFPNKFLYIYSFICNLLDISSYLILQREFEILKNTFITDKYRAILESSKKINVNDQSFSSDIKECLNIKKMSILGRFKNE
jgi:hypothetical protein